MIDPRKDPRQLAFWDAEIEYFWDYFNEMFIVTLMDGVSEGVATLPKETRVLSDWNVINRNVLEYVRQYRYNWIKKITDTTRNQVQQAITDWMREGSPLKALAARLEPVFSKARAEMIAVTEVTRVYAAGNQIAWESTGVVSGMKWNTAQDERVCPICGPLADTIMGIGDIDAMPPAHVNCRCYTLPVVSEDMFQKRLNEIFK